MGVDDLVTDDEQRRAALVGGPLQNFVHRGVGMGCGVGDDALVRAPGGHLVELAPVRHADDGPGLLGLAAKAAQPVIRITGGGEDLVDGAAAAQRFADGVPAHQNVLPLGDLVFSLFSLAAILCHGCRSFAAPG